MTFSYQAALLIAAGLIVRVGKTRNARVGLTTAGRGAAQASAFTSN